MKLAVAITANDRPHYLREVLESWRDVEGIDKVPMVFTVEPGNEEVLDLCRSVDFAASTDVYVNTKRLGPHVSPYHALRRAFVGDVQFVILAEDDSVVSDDVLDYFTAMATAYDEDEGIFAVCACNLRCGICCDRDFHVRRGAFCSTVWGLWDYRWAEVKQTWGMTYEDSGGWDMKFAASVKGARDCLIPCVSRAQHIGQYGGVHMRPEDFESMRSRCFDPEPDRVENWRVMRSYQ